MDIREQIAQEIEDFARAGYEGAAMTESVEVLAMAEIINTALLHAAAIARGDE